jgi:uncharacterized membrane protein YdjX (TVP38/TMEM64 family)
MGRIQVAMGIVALAIMSGIGINIYETSMVNANQTGWNATVLQASNNWLPLVFMAVIIIIVLMSAVGKSRA